MAKVFFTIQGGTPRGIVSFRREDDGQPQSLNRIVPDGDTIGVQLDGSGSTRLLGIDTPEKSFRVEGARGNSRLDSPEWEAYLTNPFDPQFGQYDLDPDLIAHLQSRIGAGAGANHSAHGENAGQALKDLIQADMDALGQGSDTFEFFIAFSYEVFDSFGRFLTFVNRNQPDANNPSPRPRSYNERMLENGMALPYFIWPNVDPFRGPSILEAVIAPGTANTVAQASASLSRARTFVQQARNAQIGVFERANPLIFEAFEVRYLGGRRAPSRAVIDLSQNDNVILRPQSYYRIPNPEDRLFIPLQYVPLFASRGWKLEGWG